MVRVAIASVVSLLALPGAAHAAVPAAHPPAKSVAGVKLTWPVKTAETSLAPGSKLSVKVRSSHRRAVVSLLRADARGIPTRLLARRTLRSGTFTAKLPADQGALYQLRVVIAGKRYWSWIGTPPAPAPPAPSPPLPKPVTVVDLSCDVVFGPETYSVRLPAGPITSGVEFSYTVHGYRGVDNGATWQFRDAGGNWAAYPDGEVESGAQEFNFRDVTRTASLPASAPAGSYRLLESITQPAPNPCDHMTTEVLVPSGEIVVP